MAEIQDCTETPGPSFPHTSLKISYMHVMYQGHTITHDSMNVCRVQHIMCIYYIHTDGTHTHTHTHSVAQMMSDICTKHQTTVNNRRPHEFLISDYVDYWRVSEIHAGAISAMILVVK